MIRAALPFRALLLAAVASLLLVAADRPAESDAKATANGKSAAPAKGKPRGPAPYRVRILSCRRSPRIDERVATVGASMRPIAAGGRMALRVELLQRPLAGGRWMVRSDVPGLGEWTAPSDRSIGTRSNDLFKYRQAVGRLVVPFAYRFRVGFRWSDASGRVVREEQVKSGPCREPDLRPDLVVSEVAVTPIVGRDRAVYSVTVRNVGRSVAKAVEVGTTAAPLIRTVRRIAPRGRAVVRFAGPACDGTAPPPTFTVDPSDAIDEMREGNNTLAATCPGTLERP